MNEKSDEFVKSLNDDAEDALEIESFIESEEEEMTAPRWEAIVGIISLIVLCDLTIYRGHGFAGYAVLFVVAPLLLWFSSAKRCRGVAFWIVSAMLVLLAGKMIWFGSGSLVAIGFGLMIAFAMLLSGFVPYFFEALFFTLQVLFSGITVFFQSLKLHSHLNPKFSRTGWFSFILPAVALVVFGMIFVFANPNLSDWFGNSLKHLIENIQNWVSQLSLDPGEIFFWWFVLFMVIGLLNPSIYKVTFDSPKRKRQVETSPVQSPFYSAFRNTLVTVIVLFAVYLVFEFKTLWFHEFENGFHYSGYAHDGAAWLTAALALASITLSLIFRGHVMRDERKGTLQTLAWVWSIENLLLAASVFNRLFIYIGFNGMTRMRIVGLFGISAVVVGFVVVIWKILHNHGFLWLVRRHLWTLAIGLYLLALTPMDSIIFSYNTQRILNGHLAPSVQMSVQNINSEGILKLLPLLECDNEIIREGTRALLAQHHAKAETLATQRSTLGWTAFQIADDKALKVLRKNKQKWEQFNIPKSEDKVLKRFHDYVYQ